MSLLCKFLMFPIFSYQRLCKIFSVVLFDCPNRLARPAADLLPAAPLEQGDEDTTRTTYAMVEIIVPQTHYDPNDDHTLFVIVVKEDIINSTIGKHIANRIHSKFEKSAAEHMDQDLFSANQDLGDDLSEASKLLLLRSTASDKVF